MIVTVDTEYTKIVMYPQGTRPNSELVLIIPKIGKVIQCSPLEVLQAIELVKETTK